MKKTSSSPNHPNQPNLRYHEILKAAPDAAVKNYQKLVEGMKSQRLLYKNATIPVLLQPYFVEPTFSEELKTMINPLEKGLDRIIDFVLCPLDSKAPEEIRLITEIRDAFALTEAEFEMVRLSCGVDKHVIIHRLDLYSGEKLNILEFNTDSAAGILETDMQIKLFKNLNTVKQLAQDFSFKETYGAQKILSSLLNSEYPRRNSGETPTICITDWSDVGTKSEQENLAKYFWDSGYKTFLADPRELVYKDGELSFKDEKIDIIHRRVILIELVERFRDAQPFIQAVNEGAVSVINPFSSAIGSNKAILALLSEEKYHPLLEEDTVDIIKRHLPWTRLFHRDKDQAIIEKVIEDKDSYVLKMGKSYGGSGIIVGREASEEQWKRRTEIILESTEERWIVQEYIKPPREMYPVIQDSDLEFHELIFNINPFIIDGEYVNGMTRLSYPEQHVINVAQGGFQIPMIETDER